MKLREDRCPRMTKGVYYWSACYWHSSKILFSSGVIVEGQQQGVCLLLPLTVSYTLQKSCTAITLLLRHADISTHIGAVMLWDTISLGFKKKGQMVNKIHKCCTVTQQRTDDTSQRPKEHLQIIHALCFRSEIFFFFSCYQSLLKWSGQTVERDEGADEIKDRRDEQRLEEGERERRRWEKGKEGMMTEFRGW